jgi:transposase
LRVAAYGAAVGDPERWPSPKQLYRAAGLTPRIYESAGRRRDGHITRDGSVPLRVALVDLGLGLWPKEPAARAHGASRRARGQPGAVITIAMAHRANRIAFGSAINSPGTEAAGPHDVPLIERDTPLPFARSGRPVDTVLTVAHRHR